jgi:alpha-aminoadipate carrier protein LysW|tara:strand:- start:1236 stop:1433 length:198 start_codon:yes stop_codon:yes gene_type:complete
MKKSGVNLDKMTNCTECDANVNIPTDAVEGEIVTCAECGASYELVKTSDGFELKPAQTVGEDWGQ